MPQDRWGEREYGENDTLGVKNEGRVESNKTAAGCPVKEVKNVTQWMRKDLGSQRLGNYTDVRNVME